MTLNVWTESSGFSLGTFQESTPVEINLPILQNTSSSVQFTIISGKLPDGLFINNRKIAGIAYEVARATVFKFCIRASHGYEISDRTFYITIEGADSPVFITPAGLLPMHASEPYLQQTLILNSSISVTKGDTIQQANTTGYGIIKADYVGTNITFATFSNSWNTTDNIKINGGIQIGKHPITILDPVTVTENSQLYVVDSTEVSYQLSAFDLDTSAGQTLSYFIATGDGQLPPGLSISKSGLISGYVEPALALQARFGDGSYDESFYDDAPYDFAVKPSNGYDSFAYDLPTFDFSSLTTTPKKLNRTYEFKVTVTDGDSYVKRVFRIFVVGDDYFRADNTAFVNDPTNFTADITYIHKPIWKTSSDLGSYRADNYLLIPLEVYDTENVIYEIQDLNSLPAGLNFDIRTGSIYGILPFQAAVSKRYTFTVSAIRSANPNTVHGTFVSYANNKLILKSVVGVINVGDTVYATGLVGTAGTPTVASISTVNGQEVAILNNVNNDKTYIDVNANVSFGSSTAETAIATQEFTMKIVGELDSVISWITANDLGTMYANTPCTISLQTRCTNPNVTVNYTLTEGILPPGLSLDINGDLVGIVNQYSTDKIAGLFAIDNEQTTFDLDSTTFERHFIFTVKAKDQNGLSENFRTFSLQISTPSHTKFSNITVKPLLPINQRSLWHDFIYNNSIFTQDKIYRMNDSNFGIQDTLSMLVYAGIETKPTAAYIGAIGLNTKIKRFAFGELKTATVTNPTTNDVIYEVIYISMVDPMEKDGVSVPLSINASVQSPAVTADISNDFWNTPINSDAAGNLSSPSRRVTVDSQGYMVSNANPSTYFPNTITNWRRRIKRIGMSEPLFLPAWMRSIQSDTKLELGYVPAIPICYCNPGMANSILLNIKNSDFDFKAIDYTIDRFIINAVDGYTGDKYLVFNNERITI